MVGRIGPDAQNVVLVVVRVSARRGPFQAAEVPVSLVRAVVFVDHRLYRVVLFEGVVLAGEHLLVDCRGGHHPAFGAGIEDRLGAVRGRSGLRRAVRVAPEVVLAVGALAGPVAEPPVAVVLRDAVGLEEDARIARRNLEVRRVGRGDRVGDAAPGEAERAAPLEVGSHAVPVVVVRGVAVADVAVHDHSALVGVSCDASRQIPDGEGPDEFLFGVQEAHLAEPSQIAALRGLERQFAVASDLHLLGIVGRGVGVVPLAVDCQRVVGSQEVVGEDDFGVFRLFAAVEEAARPDIDRDLLAVGARDEGVGLAVGPALGEIARLFGLIPGEPVVGRGDVRHGDRVDGVRLQLLHVDLDGDGHVFRAVGHGHGDVNLLAGQVHGQRHEPKFLRRGERLRLLHDDGGVVARGLGPGFARGDVDRDVAGDSLAVTPQRRAVEFVAGVFRARNHEPDVRHGVPQRERRRGGLARGRGGGVDRGLVVGQGVFSRVGGVARARLTLFHGNRRMKSAVAVGRVGAVRIVDDQVHAALHGGFGLEDENAAVLAGVAGVQRRAGVLEKGFDRGDDADPVARRPEDRVGVAVLHADFGPGLGEGPADERDHVPALARFGLQRRVFRVAGEEKQGR